MSVLVHLRQAARRHAHLADAAIALAVFAATLLTAFAGRSAVAGGHRTVAITAAALGCGALAGRRRRPLMVLTASAGAAEVFLAESGSTSGVLILLAPLIALYTVADLVERRPGLILGCAAVAVLALVHAVHRPALLGPQNLAFMALGGLAIAAGDSSRNRRAYLAEAERRAERAERERELDARRRIAEERLRIARDLHDAVGHHLALISVQSNVAGQALDSDTAAASEALAHVKSASRKALGELRDTVGLLRQPGDPVAPTAIPAPGLDGLDELLASLRASGLGIDFRVDGKVVPLAPAADLTAYRVIQESLTNVYKHSGRRQARLTLRYDRHELRITVDDPGGERAVGGRAQTSGPVPAGRHGIVGMRERVLALGGHFTAGPRPGGAFRVTADLPCQPLDLAPEPAP
ncbi:sensor histidine kinase [Streptomyces sp. NPDC058964]|uniref:sensor histidine kinase n=1 Tax=Streptomyces sp. NPDC058964 TaxID=3346681 RepID=UPI00368BDB7E